MSNYPTLKQLTKKSKLRTNDNRLRCCCYGIRVGEFQRGNNYTEVPRAMCGIIHVNGGYRQNEREDAVREDLMVLLSDGEGNMKTDLMMDKEESTRSWKHEVEEKRDTMIL